MDKKVLNILVDLTFNCNLKTFSSNLLSVAYLKAYLKFVGSGRSDFA